MIQELTKCIVVLLTMATMSAKMAAQTQAERNTDSAAPPIILNGDWNLIVNSPQGPATALIGISPVNGFSGSVTATCFFTAPPGNTDRPCSVSPSPLPIGPSGGQISVSVPTQGLSPGEYTIEVDATAFPGSDQSIGLGVSQPCRSSDPNCVIHSGSPNCGLEFPPPPECTQPSAPVSSGPAPKSTSRFLKLSIRKPAEAKAAGGSFIAWVCFALLVVFWAWRHKKDVKRTSLI